MTLLEVKNLWIRFPAAHGVVEAVRGVSFTAGREKVGIVGESGAGKSAIGRALLRLLPPAAEVSADAIRFDGNELTGLSEKQMRALRGRRMSMVMQDPKYSLNPVRTVGRQIDEAFIAHTGAGRRSAKRCTLEMLEAVQIRDPERVYRLYPHQVSGGMGQRVMIAMMLIAEPDLLIADEPTSALDVTVQQQVLAILDELVCRRGMGLLFISHDLPLVSAFCDRVLVMYRGKIIEELRADQLHNSTHPYTRGLLDCLPTIDDAPLPVLRGDHRWLEEG